MMSGEAPSLQARMQGGARRAPSGGGSSPLAGSRERRRPTSALRDGGVERDAADVLVDAKRHLDRRQRPLLAIGPLAEPTGHADRDARVGVLEIDAVGVDEL